MAKTSKAQSSRQKVLFSIDPNLSKQVKYIALMDNKNASDIAEEALSQYVSRWEKENGKLKIKE